MRHTENYGLRLPQHGENASVNDLNYNAEAIDNLIYRTRQIEGDAYIDDGSKVYNTGDLCIYIHAMYECFEDGVSGPWDATKWRETNINEQLEKRGGGSAEVTKEASGNPIELTDAASAPLVKCVTAITGSQDLHGYDKPWVGGAGKNKLSTTLEYLKTTNAFGTWSGNVYTFNNVSFTVAVDNANNVGEIKVNGTASDDISFSLGSSTTLVDGISYIFTSGNSSASTSTFFINIAGVGSDGQQISFTASSGMSNPRLYIRSGATVTNQTFKPMIRLSTETDSTFAPYSNICPITAYTDGEIEVRGKNILDRTNDVNGYSMSQSGATTANADMCYSALHHVETGTTYTFSGISAVMAYRGVIGFDASGNYVVGCGATSSQIAVGNLYSVTFTVPNGVAQIRTSFGINDTKVQIEKGSSVTDYEPYVGTTHTTTYPSAIYRGSEDVVNVEVTVTHKKYTPTNWTRNSDHEFYTYFDSSEISTGTRRPCISDKFRAWNGTESTSTYGICFINTDGALRINTVDSYSSASAMMAAIGDISFVCDLATPTTTSVTPTNLPIKSLAGYTHIESTTGDMEVEYITQGYQPIVDLIDEAADTKHAYSTTEHVVGKWIDGSDVYEKEIITEFNNAAPQYTLDLSSIGGVSIMPIFVSHSVLDAMEGSTPIKQIKMPAATNSTYSSITVQHQSSAVTGKAYITVRYIKLTSNNRSLSKGATTRSLSAPVASQKAQIEPLTDKTEDSPNEDEKSLKTDENVVTEENKVEEQKEEEPANEIENER